MTVENPRYPNFLDKKNPVFVGFHHSPDNLFRQLREEGVGAESQQTPTIGIEEENLLWDKSTLNTSTPKGLFRAVFYYNSKNFVLRGGLGLLCRGRARSAVTQGNDGGWLMGGVKEGCT